MQVLAIDIGGSGLKAALLDADGEMLTDRVRVPTPHPCLPDVLVEKLLELVEPLEGYTHVSVGFPGVVRGGRIVTAPNLGTRALREFDLAGALRQRLGKPVCVINDADMQGLAAIEGNGIEMVITLGTGFGTALFEDGRISPHLEIGQHPFRKGDTYDQHLGSKALKQVGKKRWNKRVKKAISTLRTLTSYDTLYIGGGNASKIDFKAGPHVKTVPNEYGVKGGAWLWKNERIAKE